MPKKMKAKVRGVARVKKYRDDQDPETDEPAEITERAFDLNEEQAQEIQHGRAFVELDNDVMKVRRKSDHTTILPETAKTLNKEM